MLMPVTSFDLRQRTLEFRSSSQGIFNATALVANDIQLVNAIELLDFSDAVVQLIVCEHCGVPHCAPGSCAGLRRVDEQIVLTPAFAAMREGEWDLREYAPPEYMLTKGLPTFSTGVYDELRDKTGRFPDPSKVSECTSQDTLDLLQFTAPGGVLGKLGSTAVVQSEYVVAVTEGDMSEELETLSRLVRSIQDGEEGLHSLRSERVVEFHLDIIEFPAWRPFGYDPGGPVLNLGEILH